MLSSLVRHDQALITTEFAVPRLCNRGWSSAVLDSAEWAVACRINGRVTVGELAGHCGIPLHDAMDRVNRLIRSGLCEAASVAADSPVLMPRRRPEKAAAVPESRRARGTDLGLLRQVLDGLNSLD